jgi:tight adherence protein C
MPLAQAGWSFLWQIVISATIFGAVFLFITSLFGQGGEIAVSPQRASAIATGHMDRRTVFENNLIRPMLWIFLALAHRLAMPRLKAWMGRQLEATGNPNYYTVEEYLALALFAGAATGLMLVVFGGILSGSLGVAWVLLLLGFLSGTGLTIIQLHTTASKRMNLIWKRIPYALDLIGLAMGAGATFTEAVRTIVSEDETDPFNVELRTLLAEMDLGTTRRRALQNLSDRIPLEELRSIIASVVQAEELGTPLSEVLHDQATLLRLQRTVRAEQAAAVASVRILVPCLLLVMAVVLAVFGPAIVRIIQGGLF